MCVSVCLSAALTFELKCAPQSIWSWPQSTTLLSNNNSTTEIGLLFIQLENILPFSIDSQQKEAKIFNNIFKIEMNSVCFMSKNIKFNNGKCFEVSTMNILVFNGINFVILIYMNLNGLVKFSIDIEPSFLWVEIVDHNG